MASARSRAARVEDGVYFHFFRYAPVASLNVFGYAAALRADVTLRGAARGRGAAGARRRMVRGARAVAQTAARDRHARALGGARRRDRRGAPRPALPLVVSLHGSDVYRRRAACRRRGVAARRALRARRRRDRLQRRPRDAARSRSAPMPRGSETVPYGVDAGAVRARPGGARGAAARSWASRDDAAWSFAAGRLVRKKGFEYLIDALARSRPDGRAAAGDRRRRRPRRRAARARRDRAASPSASASWATCRRTRSAQWLAAADVDRRAVGARRRAATSTACRTSCSKRWRRATPVVATTAGGIGAVVERRRRRGCSCRSATPAALARGDRAAARRPATRPGARARGARASSRRDSAGTRVAERFEAAYDRALAFKSLTRAKI